MKTFVAPLPNARDLHEDVYSYATAAARFPALDAALLGTARPPKYLVKKSASFRAVRRGTVNANLARIQGAIAGLRTGQGGGGTVQGKHGASHQADFSALQRGVIRAQAVWRGRVVRRDVRRAQERVADERERAADALASRRQHGAAVTLQRRVRGWGVRRELMAQRQAATVLQSAHRGSHGTVRHGCTL